MQSLKFFTLHSTFQPHVTTAVMTHNLTAVVHSGNGKTKDESWQEHPSPDEFTDYVVPSPMNSRLAAATVTSSDYMSTSTTNVMRAGFCCVCGIPRALYIFFGLRLGGGVLTIFVFLNACERKFICS